MAEKPGRSIAEAGGMKVKYNDWATPIVGSRISRAGG